MWKFPKRVSLIVWRLLTLIRPHSICFKPEIWCPDAKRETEREGKSASANGSSVCILMETIANVFTMMHPICSARQCRCAQLLLLPSLTCHDCAMPMFTWFMLPTRNYTRFFFMFKCNCLFFIGCFSHCETRDAQCNHNINARFALHISCLTLTRFCFVFFFANFVV